MTQNPCQVMLSRYGIVRSWHCQAMTPLSCHVRSWHYMSHTLSIMVLPVPSCQVMVLSAMSCQVLVLSCILPVMILLVMSCVTCPDIVHNVVSCCDTVHPCHDPARDSQSCQWITVHCLSRQAMTHGSWLTVLSHHFLSCSCESVTHLESCHVTSCHGPVSLWLTLSHVTLPPVMVLWVCDSPWVMSRYLLSWSCESVTHLESCHIISCHGPVSPWLTLSHVTCYLLSWSCEFVTHPESCHITSCHDPVSLWLTLSHVTLPPVMVLLSLGHPRLWPLWMSSYGPPSAHDLTQPITPAPNSPRTQTSFLSPLLTPKCSPFRMAFDCYHPSGGNSKGAGFFICWGPIVLYIFP